MLGRERRAVHRVGEEHLLAKRLRERKAAGEVVLHVGVEPAIGTVEHDLRYVLSQTGLSQQLGEGDSGVADTAIFVPERARPTGATAGHARAAGGELGQVENEDYVSCLLRLTSGARVVLEASRVAVGEQNNYGFEIHGTRGAVSWDFRRMNELAVSLGDAYQDQPVSTTYVGPGHGHFAAF